MFFDLPRELRDQIYEWVLFIPRGWSDLYHKPPINTGSLRRVNKPIKKEFEDVLCRVSRGKFWLPSLAELDPGGDRSPWVFPEVLLRQLRRVQFYITDDGPSPDRPTPSFDFIKSFHSLEDVRISVHGCVDNRRCDTILEEFLSVVEGMTTVKFIYAFIRKEVHYMLKNTKERALESTDKGSMTAWRPITCLPEDDFAHMCWISNSQRRW